MTLQEPQNQPIADVDMPDTEVIVVAHPSPVFVDTTGRRSRMLRRVAYGFGALCMVYGGLVSVSLAGGPVSSSAVLPLPDLADDSDEEDVVVARPRPIPEPVTTTQASQPILEVFPKRGVPVTRPQQARAVTPRTTSASPRPARTPSPTPTTKKPTSATAKPVESASTKPTTPDTTTPTTEPPAPVPPAPPQIPSGDSGGQGGGQGSGGSADEAPATQAPAEPKPVPPAPPAVTTEPASAEPTGESGPGDGS